MKLTPLVNRLSIVQKDLSVVKFGDVMNWAQLELLQTVERLIDEKKPIRIIVLKARQLGISTEIEAIMFVMAFLLKRMRGLVISHDLDSSEHLLSITQHYWDTYPFKDLYTQKYKGAKRLSWVETGSLLRIATAANVRAGRSATLQVVHASEVAFYDDPKTLMTGLGQAIPNKPLTALFLESTANGIGNYFHETWEGAEDGSNDFIPLFFPWWKHPEYVMPFSKPLGKLDDEEKVLSGFLGMQGMDSEEIRLRLAWRRWAIRNNCMNNVELFHQEYPSTPEEAFVSTGKNIFPITHLREVYEQMDGIKGRLVREGSKVRFQPDITGPLTVFRWPDTDDLEWGSYFVAGDPTHSTVGDYACAQVLSRRTWEQVAVWRGKTDPNTFGEELAKLGTYYNKAMLTSEIEGPGYATIAKLLHLEYPFIWKHRLADKTPGTFDERWGWSSTFKTKNEAIGNLLKVLVDHDIVIHDSKTFSEMKNYVQLPSGSFGNSNDEEHDDTVMALAICVTCILYEAPTLMAYGVGKQRKELEERQEQEPVWSDWSTH